MFSLTIIQCDACGHKNGHRPDDEDAGEPQCCKCGQALDLAKKRDIQKPQPRPATSDEINESLLEVN